MLYVDEKIKTLICRKTQHKRRELLESVEEQVLTNNEPFVVMHFIVYVLRDELNCGQSFGEFKTSQFSTFSRLHNLDLRLDIEKESYERAYAAKKSILL